VFRAVVFDLWQTLATWPDELSRELRRRWSSRLGVSEERLDELWSHAETYRRRETGPIASAIEALHEVIGADAGVDVDEILGWRLDLTRQALVPDTGVVSTLAALKRQGIATGLVSNCTEEVALVWHESPFAGLIDVVVFSATAGCMKPDARIYLLACEELGVEPHECLFVGDGANDELRGAQEVGMTPVLIHAAGREPHWEEVRDWSGWRVSSIPEVLAMIR
jgi:putative hydrolase of the HAD superfamily